MSLFKLPFLLSSIQKLGNVSLVLMIGSRESLNMGAAVVPHSLQLETQANLVEVENTVGIQTAVGY